MKAKVLITGANGFIGSALHKQLHLKKYDCVGLVRQEGINPQLIYEKIDLTDYEECERYIHASKPDVIFHCAGSANVAVSISDPNLDYELNVSVTHNLLVAIDSISKYNPVIVFLSSAAVYGNPQILPITENMEYNPLSPYALHKVMCEEMCNYYRTQHDMDIRIARIFSAYGPGLKKQIFWDMHTKYLNLKKLPMFGTGDESRDYIFIEDLVEALSLVAFGVKGKDYIFNIANGEEHTIKEVAEAFAEEEGLDKVAVSFNGVALEGSPKCWRADVSRLKELGYYPKVGIGEGIHRYVEWVEGLTNEHN